MYPAQACHQQIVITAYRARGESPRRCELSNPLSVEAATPRNVEPTVAPAARNWTQELACYREPSHARSIFEIAVTLGPLLGLWVLGWFACYFGVWWLSLILAVPAAGFLVRLFSAGP